RRRGRIHGERRGRRRGGSLRGAGGGLPARGAEPDQPALEVVEAVDAPVPLACVPEHAAGVVSAEAAGAVALGEHAPGLGLGGLARPGVSLARDRGRADAAGLLEADERLARRWIVPPEGA